MVKTSRVMAMAKTPSEKPMIRLLTRFRASPASFLQSLSGAYRSSHYVYCQVGVEHVCARCVRALFTQLPRRLVFSEIRQGASDHESTKEEPGLTPDSSSKGFSST
jgi:hypothetical protein